VKQAFACLLFLQSDTVQALRGDPDSSEAEHVRIMLVQTEVERVKFVVRSYIRTRLHKAHLTSHIC
jgi:GINS complex subunit 4